MITAGEFIRLWHSDILASMMSGKGRGKSLLKTDKWLWEQKTGEILGTWASRAAGANIQVREDPKTWQPQVPSLPVYPGAL